MDGEPHIFLEQLPGRPSQSYLHLIIFLLGCCVDIYKAIDTATNVLLYGKKASLLRGHLWLVGQSYSLTMLAEYQKSL